MNSKQYKKITTNLKQELDDLYRAGAFERIIKILKRARSKRGELVADVQISIFSQLIQGSPDRAGLVPLCDLQTVRDLQDEPAGIGFGIYPWLPNFAFKLKGFKKSRHSKVKARASARRRKKGR